MSALQTQSERWIAGPNDDLVATAKSSKNWSTALATVDAVANVLAKTTEVFVSEVGDVESFLYVTAPRKGKVHVSVVAKNTTNPANDEESSDPFTVLRSVEDAGARDLVAAFLCDFPNAVFTVDGGHPLWLFIHQQGAPKNAPPDKKWVTLANFVTAAAAGHTQFGIAVPKTEVPKTDTPKSAS